MLFSTLVAWLIMQSGPLPDTVADPVSVYAPILEHARTHSPAKPGMLLVLNEALPNVGCAGNCGDPSTRIHPGEVLARLKAGGQVDATCRVQQDPKGCFPRDREHLLVALGRVIHLPDTARVKVLPAERTPGVPLNQALAAVPDSAAVPVDVAVDVVVTRSCPARPRSDGCRVPDTLGFRYFLRKDTCGTYRVVTRWWTGAV